MHSLKLTQTTAAAILLSFTLGVVAAASIYAPLGIMDVTILPGTASPGSSGSLFTKPARIELANLTAGSSGTYTATAQLTLDNGGTVKLEIENKKILRRIFSVFNVYVTIGDKTYTLTPYGVYEAYVYLDGGTYNVTITVEYTVRADAQGSYTSLVFLKAELEDATRTYTGTTHTGTYTYTTTHHYDDDHDYDD